MALGYLALYIRHDASDTTWNTLLLRTNSHGHLYLPQKRVYDGRAVLDESVLEDCNIIRPESEQ